MTVIKNATDTDLRSLLYQHDRVLVKFIDTECEICKTLAPSFEGFARDPRYKNILFLRMDARENPVSRQEVKFSKAPFIATYKKGVLKDCGIVSTREEMGDMLERLRI